MRRNTLNFLVEVAALLVMLSMIATGLVMHFVLPPGTGGRHGGPAKMLWGLGRHDLGEVHLTLGLVLTALVLIHVALHWAWVCTTVRRLLVRGEQEVTKTTAWRRNLYGVAFLGLVAAAVAAFFAVAWTNAVIMPGEGEYGLGYRGGRQQAGESQPADEEPGGLDEHEPGVGSGTGWGSMSLSEIASTYGVPLNALRQKLGLPDTVSPDERLGRLRHEYGFEMSAVRQIIQEYRAEPGR